jgi:hypothetical protein
MKQGSASCPVSFSGMNSEIDEIPAFRLIHALFRLIQIIGKL